MKTFIILTILVASGLMLLSSCRTVDVSRPNGGRQVAVTTQRTAMPQPYYGKNSEGSYYSTTEEDTNTDYRPQVKRFVPSRRAY